MKKRTFLLFKTLLLLVLCFTFTGCKAPNNVAYFQDVNETIVPLSSTEGQIRIKPFDKISIVIKSKDPALSELFNLSVNSLKLGQTSAQSGGNMQVRSYSGGYEGMSNYTVAPNGDIDFPILGELYIEGMTRSELAGFIKGELMGKNLVKDPVVSVEFINIGFSVIGEVNSPGKFDLNKDKFTLLEALALAGDLNLQGRRDNVSVIREEKDGLHTYRVDLTNLSELTHSPAYFIKQGDVIYVEPNDVRKRQTTTNGNNVLSTGFWVSVASVLASLAVLIFK